MSAGRVEAAERRGALRLRVKIGKVDSAAADLAERGDPQHAIPPPCNGLELPVSGGAANADGATSTGDVSKTVDDSNSREAANMCAGAAEGELGDVFNAGEKTDELGDPSDARAYGDVFDANAVVDALEANELSDAAKRVRTESDVSAQSTANLRNVDGTARPGCGNGSCNGSCGSLRAAPRRARRPRSSSGPMTEGTSRGLMTEASCTWRVPDRSIHFIDGVRTSLGWSCAATLRCACRRRGKGCGRTTGAIGAGPPASGPANKRGTLRRAIQAESRAT